MKKLLLTIIFAISMIAPAFARIDVPITMWADCSGYVCGKGIIQGLDPHGDGWLAVKSGPGLGFAWISKLYNGAHVYVCNTVGDWLGVVYQGNGKWDELCNINIRWLRSLPYTGPCHSGWVHQRYVEILEE